MITKKKPIKSKYYCMLCRNTFDYTSTPNFTSSISCPVCNKAVGVIKYDHPMTNILKKEVDLEVKNE